LHVSLAQKQGEKLNGIHDDIQFRVLEWQICPRTKGLHIPEGIPGRSVHTIEEAMIEVLD
jgi:hypothetical protein